MWTSREQASCALHRDSTHKVDRQAARRACLSNASCSLPVLLRGSGSGRAAHATSVGFFDEAR